MNRRRALAVLTSLSFLGIVACDTQSPTEETSRARALRLWHENLKAAERLVEAEATGEEASPELKRIDEFFWRVTGGSGLLIGHTFDNVTVSPQARSALRLLREWCEENCERLSIDPKSGQVIVLPAPQLSSDHPSESTG